MVARLIRMRIKIMIYSTPESTIIMTIKHEVILLQLTIALCVWGSLATSYILAIETTTGVIRHSLSQKNVEDVIHQKLIVINRIRFM